MALVIRKFEADKPLCDTLRDLRREAKVTLSQLEGRTKIRKAFLQALENGNYGALPEPLYAKKILTSYVKALGGKVDYFLGRFESECGTCDFSGASRLPRARARRAQFFVASRFAKYAAIALAALSVCGYLGWQVHSIVSAPPLALFAPADGLRTGEAAILVAGKTQPGSRLRVNGMEVLLMADGNFETSVALERGVNVISVESRRRYSRPVQAYRRVVLTQADRQVGSLDWPLGDN